MSSILEGIIEVLFTCSIWVSTCIVQFLNFTNFKQLGVNQVFYLLSLLTSAFKILEVFYRFQEGACWDVFSVFFPGKLKYHPVKQSFLARPVSVRHVGFQATIVSLHPPSPVPPILYTIIYLFTYYFAFKIRVSSSRLFSV